MAKVIDEGMTTPQWSCTEKSGDNKSTLDKKLEEAIQQQEVYCPPAGYLSPFLTLTPGNTSAVQLNEPLLKLSAANTVRESVNVSTILDVLSLVKKENESIPTEAKAIDLQLGDDIDNPMLNTLLSQFSHSAKENSELSQTSTSKPKVPWMMPSHQEPKPVTNGNETNRINYSFTSWGNNHQVQVTTIRDGNQQLSVVMNPSDQLVSHRLQEAMLGQGSEANIVLTEALTNDQQNQHRNQHEIPFDEDEE